jgi:prepilin-type N-terminal cleavage/methylation domain-containing protein
VNRDNGFSLLEILIALAILVVGVAAIVNVFPVGLHASKRAADFTSAGILAQEKMAELMYLGYDNLIDIDDNCGYGNQLFNFSSNNDTGKISFLSPDDAYSWRIILNNTVVNNLRKATLGIYWNDRGNERYEPFITYIAKRD